MISERTESQLQHEAIAILEAKAERSINDIRQRTDFICAFLRAQGNSQINKLNLPIRQLTMREFCHEYGADTITIFQQQGKALFQRPKKRTRDDIEREDKETLSSTTKTTVSGRLASIDVDPPPIRRVKRVLPQRAVKGKNTQIVKRVRVDQSPKVISLSSEDSGGEQDDESDDKIRLQQKNTPTATATKASNNSIHPPTTRATKKTENNQSNNNNGNSSSKEDKEEDEDEEEEFGPLFIHLEKPNHPRVGFQLDPQRTADELGLYTVHMPSEVFGRMNQIQRNSLYSQIQDIQNQLDKVKSQLRPT